MRTTSIKPTRFWKRAVAHLTDLMISVGILFLVSQQLPEGPPPVDSMSFYTKQEFFNYFVLVALACLLVVLNGLQLIYAPWKATIGQLLLNIRIVEINGGVAGKLPIAKRMFRALGSVLFIGLPGPVIALFLGFTFSVFFVIPFSTTDEVMQSAGVPDWLRIALQTLSYIALLVGLFFVIMRPIFVAIVGLKNGITNRDRATNTTYIDK